MMEVTVLQLTVTLIPPKLSPSQTSIKLNLELKDHVEAQHSINISAGFDLVFLA